MYNVCYMSPEFLSVAQRVHGQLMQLPRAEALVADALLSNYPAAGLNTVASLAKHADVSPPTVLRLIERIGFDGFADFQDALRDELHERSLAPIDRLVEFTGGDDPISRSREAFIRGIAETYDRLSPVAVRTAVDLLAAPRSRVFASGGRFTFALAKNLVQQLEILRPNVWFLSTDDRTTVLADLRAQDVVFIADLRRYQPSTVTFGVEAARRGAKIILLTDRWLSPIADVATAVLPVSLDAPHPLDSMVHALAVVETLLAGVVDALGDAPVERMKRYDEAWETRGFSNTYWRRFDEPPVPAGRVGLSTDSEEQE
jgi:DNA-binding MurR/RpiR family transcriptional regulator